MTYELLIQHQGTVMLPPVVENVSIEWERQGQPGKLTAEVVKTPGLSFQEGDPCRFSVDGTPVFYGFVFEKSRKGSTDEIIQITVYDQLYYLKNKDTYVYTNKTAADVIRMIAEDFQLNVGDLEDTGYTIGSRVEDNQTLFDIIQTALDETLKATSQMYVLYDDVGKLTLKNIGSMKLGLLIDEDTAGNFDYKSSIASQTYDKIKLSYENKETGKREIFVAQDSFNINQWGVLQYYEKLDSTENVRAMADALLDLYNTKTRTLKLRDVIGDIRVRAGTLLVVMLGLGDINVSNYLMVEQIKHTFNMPTSITVPQTIYGGTSVTVSWAASTDAESNLEGYIVERSINGGSSWSQIYQGSATSTSNTVAFGTASVTYRVKAYDSAGLESGWKTSNTVTVTNNRAPSAPGSLTVPAIVRGGSTLAISWTAASDSDGNLSGYELERQVDGGGWSQIYKGSALAYTDTITSGWNTVAYRVRAYDAYNATSTYVTSETRTVDNNALPTITSSTTSGSNLGTKETGFDLTYTVNDADKDTVTVKEYLDDVLKRTYTATLGQSNTVQCVTTANWQKVLNGAHTIKVVANDGKVDSAPYIVTFTKAVYEASITLAAPMDADDNITVMVLNILGSIPADANMEVLVTNNAKDDEPVWENATADIKNGNNHIFENQTAKNGFAFNFKINVSRGSSNTGGYITNIGGAFQ